MKKKVEFALVALLVLLLLTVSIAGFMMHKRLKGVVVSSQANNTPDSTLVILKNITSSVNFADITVKSYRLTKDKSHREKINWVKSQVDTLSIQFIKLASPTDIHDEALELDSILNRRFQIFDSLMYLDDYFRVQPALGKVEYDIKNLSETRLQDTLKDDTLKTGFFARAFRSKKKRNLIESRRNESMVEWANELENLIENVRKEERYIENKLKQKELNLLKSDSICSAAFVDVLLKIDTKKNQTVRSKFKFAEHQINEVNGIISLFSLLALLLLLFMVFLIYIYLRKNAQYKKVLKKTTDEAYRYANAKEQFLANMSHEIRTPLNSINGFTLLLGESNLTEEQKEHLQIIKQSNEHLMAVINDILDYSKLESGKMKLINTSFSISTILHDICDMLSANAKTNDVTLELDIKNDDFDYRKGDVYRIKQVLINLVSNAIKFSPKGKVVLECLKTQDRVTFIILDDGVGMEPQELDQVFNAFEQAESNPAGSYKGTGLGLAITQKIVNAFDGEIIIESEKDYGTSVKVILPLEISSEDEIVNYTDEIKPIENISVLIAEDELFNQKLIQALFTKYKINYTIVSNGDDALRSLLNQTFDFLILDVRMPKMDGFQFMENWNKKNTNSSMKIFALTAAISEADKERLYKLGVDGVLYKPINENELIQLFTNSIEINQDMTPQNKTKEYDLSSLKETANGDIEFIIDMLKTLSSNITESIQGLTVALDEENKELVASISHKLCGALRHIQAYKSYNLLKEMEAKARNNEEVTLLNNLLLQLKPVLSQLNKSIINEISLLN